MSRVSDQDRLMMQRRASAAERRNSPRMLIVLAVIVLLAAGVYALLGYTERNGALRTLSSSQFTQQNVQNQLATYRSLQNPQESGDGPVIYERLSNPLSLLQQAARDAEIEPPVFDSERSESEAGSAHRRVFVFEQFAVAKASDPIRWAAAVERDIEGMRVHSLLLRPKPDKTGWNVTLSFSRLEKKQ
ncbi:MAG: hypothetical protein Phyf2KO_22170 [Phycisphaerales bacterium]